MLGIRDILVGIRDILVRIRIRGPYLWLMDPDPTLDQTPFFCDKKKISLYFFLINYPQDHYFSLKNLILCLSFVLKFYFCKNYFIPLNIFMRKGKDPKPDPQLDPYLLLLDPDPDPHHWL